MQLTSVTNHEKTKTTADRNEAFRIGKPDCLEG